MSEKIPESDILYSAPREEPRPTFAFPKEFIKPSYDYEDIFINDLVIDQQPYDLNKYSPTPLDPFHLKMHGSDYFTSASIYMEDRLMESSNAVGLSDHARLTIASEIEYEHLHRSLKNNESMKRLRVEFEDKGPVDAMTAELILRARAGRATFAEIAYILSAFPSIEAIEVMKYTAPLETAESNLSSQKAIDPRSQNGLDFAHAMFMYSVHMAGRENPNMIIDTSTRRPAQPRRSHGSVMGNVFITKGKECDIYLNNTHMELMSPSGYYVPDTPEPALDGVKYETAVINDREVKMYGIALSKYLRVAHPDNNQ